VLREGMKCVNSWMNEAFGLNAVDFISIPSLANNYLTFSPSDYSIKFNKDINKIKTPDMIFILEDEENIKKLLKYNANNIFANNEFNELIHSIENISVLNKFDKKVYGLNDNFKV
jgi:hypothetical protein